VVLMAMLGEYRRRKARAERDAAYDSLTGLHNRRAADAAPEPMIARSRRSKSPLAVVSFDLDRFKQVNDLYGHEIGDDLLAEVGRVLPAACGLGDFVARVGGEEFLVLLPDTDEEGARVVAEKIRALIGSLVLPHFDAAVTAQPRDRLPPPRRPRRPRPPPPRRRRSLRRQTRRKKPLHPRHCAARTDAGRTRDTTSHRHLRVIRHRWSPSRLILAPRSGA
jgi:diguanylate cyclase (GGDEF)-like protein